MGVAAPSAPQEMKRTLGLVILRGETVVSISIEGPPPKEAEESTAVSTPMIWNSCCLSSSLTCFSPALSSCSSLLDLERESPPDEAWVSEEVSHHLVLVPSFVPTRN